MQKNEISNANPHGSDGVPHPDFQLSAKLVRPVRTSRSNCDELADTISLL